MPLRKLIFVTFACLALIAACAAAGLQLAPYVAVRLGKTPFVGAAVEGEKIPPALAELVDSAQKSVVLAAETIDSKDVLEALLRAAQRKVPVAVLLSGPSNADGSPLRRYLGAKGLPVHLTQHPLHGTVLVIDQVRAATSASAPLSRAALAKEESVLFVYDHKPTASALFATLKRWSAD